MNEGDILREVDERFPGLQHLIGAAVDGFYMYLHTIIQAGDITTLTGAPNVLTYLEYDYLDRDPVKAPPSHEYQALSDLCRLVVEWQRDVEAHDFWDSDD